MRLRHALSALGAVALVVAMASGLRADIPTLPFGPSVLSSAAPLIYGRCPGGQSTAVVQALATTIPGPTPTPVATGTPTAGPTSTPIAAIFTAQVWTAADIGSKPGPTQSPYYASPGPTFSTAPYKVYVGLASDQWVFVQLSFTQGVVPVTITCSAAVARAGGGATGAPGPAGPTGPPGSPGPAGTISPVPSGSPPINWNSTTNVVSCGACVTAGSTCTVSCVGVLLQTGASPTPQAGYVGLTGTALWDTGNTAVFIGPNPTPSPGYLPQAVEVQMGNTAFGCSNGFRAGWGTNGTPLLGVVGDLFSVECPGTGAPEFNIDVAGDVSYAKYIIGATNELTQGTVGFPGCGTSCAGLYFTNAGCVLYDYQANAELYLQQYNGGTSNCSLGIASIGSGKLVCTDTASGSQLLSSCGLTPTKGQVSCALSALACTATASVTSGSTCTAAYDTAATTVTFALLLPLTVSVSSTTLSVGMQGAATATGTAAADYLCF